MNKISTNQNKLYIDFKSKNNINSHQESFQKILNASDLINSPSVLYVILSFLQDTIYDFVCKIFRKENFFVFVKEIEKLPLEKIKDYFSIKIEEIKKKIEDYNYIQNSTYEKVIPYKKTYQKIFPIILSNCDPETESSCIKKKYYNNYNFNHKRIFLCINSYQKNLYYTTEGLFNSLNVKKINKNIENYSIINKFIEKFIKQNKQNKQNIKDWITENWQFIEKFIKQNKQNIKDWITENWQFIEKQDDENSQDWLIKQSNKNIKEWFIKYWFKNWLKKNKKEIWLKNNKNKIESINLYDENFEIYAANTDKIIELGKIILNLNLNLRFSKIKRINISNINSSFILRSLKFCQNIPNVTKLALKGLNLENENLKGIKNLSNTLIELNLSRNKIKSFKYISLLKKLKILILRRNAIDNLKKLYDLKKLEELDLFSNPLKINSFIMKELISLKEHMENLTYLSISGTSHDNIIPFIPTKKSTFFKNLMNTFLYFN